MFYGSLTNGSIAAAQLNHLYFSVITVRESGTNSCQVGTVKGRQENLGPQS